MYKNVIVKYLNTPVSFDGLTMGISMARRYYSTLSVKQVLGPSPNLLFRYFIETLLGTVSGKTVHPLNRAVFI